MELLGIGPLELLFVLVIVLLVVNPKDIQQTASTVGRWLNRFFKSENYQAIRQLQHLPNQLARMAEMEERAKDVEGNVPAPEFKAWTEPLPPEAAPPPEPPADQADPPA